MNAGRESIFGAAGISFRIMGGCSVRTMMKRHGGGRNSVEDVWLC